MSEVRLSDQALEDLSDIWLFIAKDNQTAASKLVHEITLKYNKLADNPFMGRSRSEIRAEFRSFSVGAYLILYVPIPNGVLIHRILHGARNIEDILRKDEDYN